MLSAQTGKESTEETEQKDNRRESSASVGAGEWYLEGGKDREETDVALPRGWAEGPGALCRIVSELPLIVARSIKKDEATERGDT